MPSLYKDAMIATLKSSRFMHVFLLLFLVLCTWGAAQEQNLEILQSILVVVTSALVGMFVGHFLYLVRLVLWRRQRALCIAAILFFYFSYVSGIEAAVASAMALILTGLLAGLSGSVALAENFHSSKPQERQRWANYHGIDLRLEKEIPLPDNPAYADQTTYLTVREQHLLSCAVKKIKNIWTSVTLLLFLLFLLKSGVDYILSDYSVGTLLDDEELLPLSGSDFTTTAIIAVFACFFCMSSLFCLIFVVMLRSFIGGFIKKDLRTGEKILLQGQISHYKKSGFSRKIYLGGSEGRTVFRCMSLGEENHAIASSLCEGDPVEIELAKNSRILLHVRKTSDKQIHVDIIPDRPI